MQGLSFSTWLISAAALVLVACGTPGGGADGSDDDQPATPIEPDDAAAVLAGQICASLLECECPNAAGYTDLAACVEYEQARLQTSIDGLLAEGGAWDADCAGALAKTFRDWDCLGQTMATQQAAYDALACPLVKGTVAAGGDCWRSAIGDACQPGLLCLSGVCVANISLPVPLGGTCEYEWDYLPCAAGSYCTYTDTSDTRICVELPKEGDPCTDYLCGPPANDLYCDAGTCRAAPGAGEPCFDGFLCGPGHYCDGGQDSTCQPRQELGQGCGADPVCPVDASCISNVCEADPAAVCNAPAYFPS